MRMRLWKPYDCCWAKVESGRTQSCGCLAREKTSERNRKELRDRDNSAYHVWQMIHQRCSNINRASYPRYGGRGITVCDRWNDFHSFLEDMGPRPSFAYSIHRIDNDGDYEPGNCRWATCKEQAVNRGATQLVTVDGITDSVHATEQRIGINSGSLRDWIKRGRSAQQVVDKWRATSASCRDNRKILFPRSRLTAK